MTRERLGVGVTENDLRSYLGGGRWAYRVVSRAIVSVRARSTSDIRSTECRRLRWLAPIPHSPLRIIATATATTSVRASVCHSEARCTRLAI